MIFWKEREKAGEFFEFEEKRIAIHEPTVYTAIRSIWNNNLAKRKKRKLVEAPLLAKKKIDWNMQTN